MRLSLPFQGTTKLNKCLFQLNTATKMISNWVILTPWSKSRQEQWRSKLSSLRLSCRSSRRSSHRHPRATKPPTQACPTAPHSWWSTTTILSCLSSKTSSRWAHRIISKEFAFNSTFLISDQIETESLSAQHSKQRKSKVMMFDAEINSSVWRPTVSSGTQSS